MRTTPLSEQRELLNAKFRENGLRVTPQRMAIYAILFRAQTHPTAEQLHARLRRRFPHISLDTVNRTLLTFAEIGLIGIVEGYGSPRRYDPNIDSHHHAYCIHCGDIWDFYSADLDALRVPKDIRRKFNIISKRVVLSGVCSKCRR